VQGHGKQARAHARTPAPGLDPNKFAVESNVVFYLQPAIKIEKVCTTAQQHVLAIVNGWPVVVRRIERIGSSSAAEKRAGLEQCDAIAF
jgi:hypothetical protein